jgi:phosphodiesterase/alkaline phosphatase D-like protein
MPVANAGADRTVDPNLTSSFTLNGSASTDVGGIISAWAWHDITGGGNVLVGNTTVVEVPTPASVNGGARTYRLTVTDNDGNTATDTVVITVLAHTTWFMDGTTLRAVRPGGQTQEVVLGPGDPAVIRNVWIGKVTTNSLDVTAHVTTTQQVRLRVSTSADITAAKVSAFVTPNANGYARMSVGGLSPDVEYYYGIEYNNLMVKDTGMRTRTFPSTTASVLIGFSACQNSSSSTVYNRLLARNPRLFFNLGDFWYNDGGSTALSNYLTQYNNKLANTDMRNFYRRIPVAYTWSDHDYAMTGNNEGSAAAGKANAQTAYHQRVPAWEKADTGNGIYQTFRLTPRIRVVVTDNRSYKSNNSATDNSSKTVLGTTQKAWFKNILSTATEPFIIWAQDIPWIGSPSSPDDEWHAYSTERAELAAHMTSTGKKGCILAGDAHMVAADSGVNSPGGWPVLHGAALNNSASVKGGPYSQGTYGSGTVQQYGTLLVTDTGGTSMTLQYTGYDSSDVARINLTKTITL